MNPLLRLFARNTESAISGLGLLADGAARGNDRKAMLDRVYRELHSLKSEAAFLGIRSVENVCRDAEQLLGKLRAAPLTSGATTELAALRARLIAATQAGQDARTTVHRGPVRMGASTGGDSPGDRQHAAAVLPPLRRAAEEALRRGEKVYRVRPENDALTLEEVRDRLSPYGIVLGPAGPDAVLFASDRDPAHLTVHGALRNVLFAEVRPDDLPFASGPEPESDHITLSVRRPDLESLTFLLEELRATPTMPELRRKAYLDRAVALADNLGRMRFGELVAQLQPHVGDLARAAGKRVELTVAGAEQEFSVGTAEVVSGVLLHLLRNAVDHGIEKPDQRASAGKPRQGRIEVAARPHDTWVAVTVSDDGGGVHGAGPDAARRGGDLLSLISEPGYSTAGPQTVLSGRGLGLHIVQYSVDTMLGGSLSMETRAGEGTTFRFTVPQASRLLRVHICRSGERLIAIPSSVVAGVTQLEERLFSIGPAGRQFYRVKGSVAPILNASHLELEPESVALVLRGLAGGYSVYLVDSVVSEELAVRDPSRRTVVYSEHAGANATLINPENVSRR